MKVLIAKLKKYNDQARFKPLHLKPNDRKFIFDIIMKLIDIVEDE